MLTQHPIGDRAVTIKRVYDISETLPIPRGQIVAIEDWLPDDGDSGIWIVEYDSRTYQATPDELSPA